MTEVFDPQNEIHKLKKELEILKELFKTQKQLSETYPPQLPGPKKYTTQEFCPCCGRPYHYVQTYVTYKTGGDRI